MKLKGKKRPDKMDRLRKKEEKIHQKMDQLKLKLEDQKRKKRRSRVNHLMKAVIVFPAVFSRKKQWIRMVKRLMKILQNQQA